MRNTQPEHKGPEWMKTQVREAAFEMTFLSVIMFACLVFVMSRYGDWISKAALATGILLSALYSSTLAQRPANPVRFGFPFKPYRSSSTEQELMAFLISEWKSFPRHYFWVATIPYLIILSLSVILTQHKSPYPWIDLTYFVLIAILGLIPGIPLCWGVFFTRLYLKSTSQGEA